MTTSSRAITLPILVLSLLVGGCKDDEPAATTRPDCEAIVERCHPLDPGTGPIHECHETAEAAATTNAMCVAQRASCFATCVATDAGTSDGGASDAHVEHD